MNRLAQANIRRPHQYEQFIQSLANSKTKTSDAPFKAMRDVLVFAASLGFKLKLRETFTEKGEKIEYDTMKGNEYFEILMSAIVVLENIGDHACLSAERLEERISLFEEYMCGGLRYLHEQLVVKKHPSPVVYFETLVSDYLQEN